MAGWSDLGLERDPDRPLRPVVDLSRLRLDDGQTLQVLAPRAPSLRAQRDELIELGRNLLQTVGGTPEYLTALQRFARCVYQERD